MRKQDSDGIDTTGSTGTRRRLTRRIGGVGLVLAAAGLGLASVGSAQAAQPSPAKPGQKAKPAPAPASKTGQKAKPAPAPGTSVPTCGVSDLSASFGKKLAGGMNHQGVVLKLKNTSGHTCNVRGYPGLGLENAKHKALKSTTHWGNTWYATNPGKKTLALKSGSSAEAVISWSHANANTSGAKHASYLQVTPPASKAHKTLKFPQWVDHGKLQVTALARTASLK